MNGEILIYQNQEGNIKIDVRLEDENVWLTQEQMGILFGSAKSTISDHIKNIFEEGKLEEKVGVRDFRITTIHGAIEGKTTVAGASVLARDPIAGASVLVRDTVAGASVLARA